MFTAERLSQLVLLGILSVIFILTPVFLTVMNTVNMFLRKKLGNYIFEPLTIALGTVYTLLLYNIMNFPHWDVALQIMNTDSPAKSFHEPIASEHMLTFAVIAVAAIAAYMYLRVKRQNAPPLALTLSVAAIYAGCILSVVYIAQISVNFQSGIDVILTLTAMILFPVNYIILSFTLLADVIKNAAASEWHGKGKINRFLLRFTKSSAALPTVALLALVPLSAITSALLYLFGQAPDAAIRAFTDTADWLLSEKTPPPSVYYDGHYLCTAAARGDRAIVKPLRYGIRHGHTVICNRQLLVANAFEDLIAERTPRFHRIVRHLYDKYGYPLSRHITTARRADIVYILMLPAQWIFTAVLYLFDSAPENRIASQYIR